MLVSDINIFSAAIPTAAGSDFDDVKTYVESAEKQLSNDVLGSALYATLEGDQENATHTELLRLCRLVVSLSAYYEAIPFLDIRQDGSSFAVVMSKNLAPASKDRVKKLRDATLNRRDAETDNLIAYLKETTTYHAEWKSSDAYSFAWNCLIPDATMFNEFVAIEGRATYQKLRPSIIFAQSTIISDVISNDLVDELITQHTAGSFTVPNLAIMEDLRSAIAHHSFAEAIDTMAVVVDENGIGRIYKIGESSAANEAVLFNLKRNHKRAGERMLNKVKQYIDKHLTDFATYTASDEYQAQTTASFENLADNKAFVSPV